MGDFPFEIDFASWFDNPFDEYPPIDYEEFKNQLERLQDLCEAMKGCGC